MPDQLITASYQLITAPMGLAHREALPGVNRQAGQARQSVSQSARCAGMPESVQRTMCLLTLVTSVLTCAESESSSTSRSCASAVSHDGP